MQMKMKRTSRRLILSMTNDIDEFEIKILYVIGLAFVEIRASEDIKKSKAIADVFHNIPGKISRKFTSDDIIAEIMIKSERHGLGNYIKSLLRHADERFAAKDL